jgi:hypothetical protein
MLLNRGETLLVQQPGYLLDAPGTQYGTFFLTDRRVLFEIQSRGVLSASEVGIPFQIPLPLLRNVAVGRPRIGSPVLHLQGPYGQWKLRVQDPDAVSQAIAAAREKLPELPPPPPPTPGVPSSGNRGVPPPPPPPTSAAPAVVFRCRYCGGLSPPTETKCRSCGAPI